MTILENTTWICMIVFTFKNYFSSIQKQLALFTKFLTRTTQILKYLLKPASPTTMALCLQVT